MKPNMDLAVGWAYVRCCRLNSHFPKKINAHASARSPQQWALYYIFYSVIANQLSLSPVVSGMIALPWIRGSSLVRGRRRAEEDEVFENTSFCSFFFLFF